MRLPSVLPAFTPVLILARAGPDPSTGDPQADIEPVLPALTQ